MKRGNPLRKRNVGRIEGQGLVEFALILPLFLLLLFGMVEFGRAWMAKNILTGAAREAVRVAAVQADNTAPSRLVVTNRAQEVLNSAGITGASVSVADNDVGEPTVVVKVTYNFPIIVGGFFGLIGTGPGGTIPLTSETSMRRERY